MSLLIGKHIFSVLSNDEDIKKLAGSNIYPVAIPEGCKIPFVTYGGINVVGDYTKDGILEDESTVNLGVVAESYESAATLAENVRIVLEQANKMYQGYCIQGGELIGSSDGIEENYYVIYLTFKFKTEYE